MLMLPMTSGDERLQLLRKDPTHRRILEAKVIATSFGCLMDSPNRGFPPFEGGIAIDGARMWERRKGVSSMNSTGRHHVLPKPQVSIVIPAKNEQGRIGEAIAAVHKFLTQERYDVEVIVVNDGSSDQTVQEAKQEAQGRNVRIINLPQSLGKGGAIARGIRVSTGELVGFIDADLEYPPEALPKMAQRMSEIGLDTSCVVAVRIGDQRHKLDSITSRVGRFVACSLLRLGVRDTQAGLKLFPGWFAREVLSTPRQTGWLFDLEALVLAAEHQLSIVEMPVVQRCVRRRRTGITDMIACSVPLLRFAVRRWIWSLSRRMAPQKVHPDRPRPGPS